MYNNNYIPYILGEICMLKNIVIIILSLFIISPLFAQMPYDTEIEEENLLIYNEATDKQEPQYMWGVLRNYKDEYKTKFALNTILEDNTLMFSITEEDAKKRPTNISNKQLAEKNALENDLEKKRIDKDLSTMIMDSFRVWFEDTKAAIEQAGRRDEFKDIMRILDRPVKIEKVSKNIAEHYPDAVIKIHFTNEQKMLSKCKGGGGCAANKTIWMVNPFIGDPFYTKDVVKKILIHEIGHVYGLTDQYNNIGHSDIIHTTTDRFTMGKSVMGASYSLHLKCDDVDGFINLIDLTLYLKNKTWTNSAKNGWASFCNGKGNYKPTFYKAARVLNKQAYRDEGPRGDQCVYTFTAEGKIDQKYCPKLWSFARPNDKLTYGRNGLLTNKKDEKFNYNYSYSGEKDAPSVKVTITNSGVQRTSSRKIVNGKKAWELPNGYYVSTDGGNYIQVDKQNCNIVNFIPFSDKKSYSVNFINDKLQSEYTYSFPIKNEMINMRKSGSKENRVCTVSWLGDEIIKFEKGLFFDELTDKKKDNFVLKDLAEETKMTKDQLIDRLKTECKKDLHQSIIENAKALCSYFRTVDDYFSK